MFVLIGSHFPSESSKMLSSESEKKKGDDFFKEERPLLMTLFQPIRATALERSCSLTLSKANTIEKLQRRRSVKGNDDVVCILQSRIFPFISWQIQKFSQQKRSAVERKH